MLSRLIYFRFFPSIVIIAFIISQASCQIPMNVNKEFEKAKKYKDAALVFQKSLGDHEVFFSGSAYSIHKGNIYGNPFIYSGNWQTGDIYIYGRVFFDIEMKLDIYNDVLLINHTDTKYNNQPIVINDNSLKGIFLLNRYFVKIQSDEADSLQIKEGYYELVYYDKSIVLIKHSKSIQTELKFGTDLREEYVSSTDYYIICNGRSSKINSKKALVKALSKHSKEVKRFIKANRIKYSKQKLENIVKIVRYYDSLDS